MGMFNKGFLGNLNTRLFGGKKDYNPYQAPNIDFLREAAPSVNYDFLRKPTNLTKKYQDFTNTAPKVGEQRFQDFIGSINAPSSVDAVRGELNNERLNSTVDSIYRDTRDKFGKDLMSSFGRGIFDPSTGADSDIARNSVAQIAASGARTVADARTTMGLGEIERLAEREAAGRDAYGARYEAGVGEDSQANDLWAGLIGKEGDIDLNRDTAYAQGITGNADREAARRKALADALLGIAGDSASAAKRDVWKGSLALGGDEFAKGFGGAFGKGLGGFSSGGGMGG